jgi:predicted DsbA family dithiol-disulfide isomerase
LNVIIPVYFDYASSLCYIAWCIAARLEPELDVTMSWRPLHLPAHHGEWKPGERIDGDARARIERVAGETGISLRIPERWCDSRSALEGAVFAEENGCAAAYHREVFAALYERGDDIGDRTVLVRAAVAAGLPMGRFMEFVATRRAAPQLTLIRDEAQRLGVAGYPTFLLGEFPLTGIQPLETMRLLVARHIERTCERLPGPRPAS